MQGAGLAGGGFALVGMNSTRFWAAWSCGPGLVVLGVLFGSVVQISNAINVNLAATGPVKLIVGDFAALNIVQRILAGAACAMAGYVLIALIGYIAVYWNFRLASYSADTIRVTRGLLSIRATTISMSRLRGVEISESMPSGLNRGNRII